MPESGLRVLLVEDDALVARALAHVLARQAEVVEIADSVADALQRLDADRYDLIVTDYDLGPGRPTGLDLVRTIRARPLAIPIVLVSGVLDERLRASATAAGVDACLAKPARADDLLTVVSQVRAR